MTSKLLHTSRGLAKYSDIVGIAAKVLNVLAHPLDGKALVSQASILRALIPQGI